nr:predicted protein [Mycena chlorophos]
MSNISEIVNPGTPFAYIAPDTAYETTIGQYILVGTLGAYIWDILTHLSDDYRLLTKHRIGMSTFVYFFSRLWTLLFCLGSSMFETYPLQNCALAETLVESSFAIAVPSTCLLFFLRARAIFNRNRWLNIFFFCVWLIVAGTAALTPLAIHAVNIGPTAYCINAGVRPFVAGIGISPFVHDTIIFIAISWRLYKNSNSGKVSSLVTGNSLPFFSKAILQDGQAYYLISVVANIITVVMFFNSNVAPTYRVMFTLPNLFLMNTMACRVFRNTKFGFHNRIANSAGEISSHGAISRPGAGGAAAVALPLASVSRPYNPYSPANGGVPGNKNIHVNVSSTRYEMYDMDESMAKPRHVV